MNQAIRYLAFGDSLTVGYGAGPGLGFVPQYCRKLQTALESKVLLENSGVNGATTGELLDILHKDPDIRCGLRDADLITITTGGNDLIQAALPYFYRGDPKVLKSALRSYEKNYAKLAAGIERLKKGQLRPYVIILVGLYNPLPQVTEAGYWVQRFNQFLRKLESDYVRIVDVYDSFLGKEAELLYNDHIHPNAKGYEAIAKQIERSVPLRLYEGIAK
jgi:lysophospholipase L1-like esterase